MVDVVNFILGLVSQFIGFLLKPIEFLIFATGVDIASYLEKIWEFIALICQNLIWVMDLLAIPPYLVGLIFSVFIFQGTLFLTIYGIKLFIRWWGVLW